MILHIADRFIIHFTGSAGVLLMFAFFFRYLFKVLRKKYPQATIPSKKYEILTTAALFALLFIFMREPYDVYTGMVAPVGGDPWWKSYFDFTSWILGEGTSYWGLYRWDKWED